MGWHLEMLKELRMAQHWARQMETDWEPMREQLRESHLETRWAQWTDSDWARSMQLVHQMGWHWAIQKEQQTERWWVQHLEPLKEQ